MPKRILVCVCTLLAALSLVVVDADAARIGGGRSSGGRSSMSTPYQRSTSSMSSQRNTYNRQSSGSSMSGMGGILGGLVAGGLLGSMLSGGSHSGGYYNPAYPQSSGGIGLLDIILLGAVIYFGYKWYLRRRRAQINGESQEESLIGRPADGNWGTVNYQDTNAYSSHNYGGGSGWGAGSAGALRQNFPPDFDEKEFLDGARAAYARLNSSWDHRDMDDIAQFTTPAYCAELRRQKEEDPTPTKTEILSVKASLAEGWVDAGDQIISVYIDGVVREDPKQPPLTIHEVWHFARPVNGGNWKLDGIQQVE